MKTKWMKRVVLGLLTATLLSTCFTGMAGAVDWDVTPSSTDYYVQFGNTKCMFLCNEGILGTKAGTEYYLTYTVESISYDTFANCGVIGTDQPLYSWPYVSTEDGSKGGYMEYSSENLMLEQGKTYFLKFTITEDGYKYRVGWAKGEDAEYIKFASTVGEVQTDSEYFGLWVETSGMTGKLTRVRCYDKHGNDLGIQASKGRNITIGRETMFEKDTEVDHKYTLTLNDVHNLAISNLKLSTTDTVYMEYRVESSDSITYQWGGIVGNEPKAGFPYLNGYLKCSSDDPNSPDLDDGELLREGAEYLIVFEKKSDRLNVIVQRTWKGETVSFSPDSTYGTYDKEFQYYSLWFAGPNEDGRRMNAVLEDFKCYDSNKNNLGVQFNRTVSAVHHGEIEDYAGCEALYTNETADTVFAMYEDKTIKITRNGGTQTGTFSVRDSVMTNTVDGEEVEYQYNYQVIRDAEENEYWRLHPCRLIFDSNGGSEVETQDLNEENGYMPMKPTAPTMENNTFEGWVTSDGEEFDFDRLVTESTTVYAKWSKVEYASQEADGIDIMPYVYIGAAVLILAAAGVCGGMMIRRGKKYAEKENQ